MHYKINTRWIKTAASIVATFFLFANNYFGDVCVFRNKPTGVYTLAPFMNAPETILQSGGTSKRSEDVLPSSTLMKILRDMERLIAEGKTPTLVLDKDGTLTKPNDSLSGETAEALLALMERGVKIVILSNASIDRMNAQVWGELAERRRKINERRLELGQPPMEEKVFERLTFAVSGGLSLHGYSAETGKMDNMLYQYEAPDLVAAAIMKVAQETVKYFLENAPRLPDYALGRMILEHLPGVLTITAVGLAPVEGARERFKQEEAEYRKTHNGRDRRDHWIDFIYLRMKEFMELFSHYGMDMPAIEKGGTTSVDIKAETKGQIYEKWNGSLGLDPETTFYCGDEFFIGGGDFSMIGRKLRGLIDFGGKTSSIWSLGSPIASMPLARTGPEGVLWFLKWMNGRIDHHTLLFIERAA